MRYYKVIEEGFITAIGTGTGGDEITEEKYVEIRDCINDKPVAETGYAYWLKEDMTWELVEVPIVDTADKEISGAELLTMIEEAL